MSGPAITIQFEVKNIDLLSFDGDAILVPTLADGSMQEGIAAQVREVVGDEIEAEVQSHAPIAVGAALVTNAPNLPTTRLIHVPLIEKIGIRVGVENIRRATRAGLLGANRYQLERVAVPGMGYGENGVPHEEAARAIIDEAIALKHPFPQTVVLVDTDPEMLEAFQSQISSR